jgi:tetratricopeptide (TPR) repeat protein
MKAEHRKELTTNALADYLGNALQHAKEGPSQKTLIYGGIVLLVVAIGAAFWYFSSLAKAKDSGRWEQWSGLSQDAGATADDKNILAMAEKYPGSFPETRHRLAELDKFERENAGTAQARLARFQIARLLMKQTDANGRRSENLDDKKRNLEDEKKRLDKAREMYQKLIDESGDVPALAQEAIFNTAKASEDLGDFDGAKKFYERLKKDHPKSPYVAAADKALARLNNDQDAALLKKASAKP